MGKPRRFHGEWSPREVPWVLNVLHRKNIEGSPRNFLKADRTGPKAKNPAPRVFGVWSGLGCGLGFAFRKFLGGPSIFSLGSTLSTLGKLPRGSIHHATSSAFPQIVPHCPIWAGAIQWALGWPLWSSLLLLQFVFPCLLLAPAGVSSTLKPPEVIL